MSKRSKRSQRSERSERSERERQPGSAQRARGRGAARALLGRALVVWSAGLGAGVAACACPSGGAGGQGGGGQGGGGGDPACRPSAGWEPADGCGVYVSSSLGTAAGPGTQAAPYATIQAAVDAHPGQAVYVCTDGQSAGAALGGAVTIYGGVDCTAGWGYVGATTRSPWTAAGGGPVVRVAGPDAAVTLVDLAITAPAASGYDAATGQGASAVGVLVEEGEVGLERCEVEAGAGAAGGPGADQAGIAMAGTDGQDGLGCGAAPNPGAPAVTSDCGGEQATGGKGGDGDVMTGGVGALGLPDLGGGAPGMGDTGAMGWSCANNNGQGAGGLAGPDGQGGPGGTELGVLDAALLYAGTAGASGTPGGIGQGGGGGGGRKGNGANGCAVGQGGPSGGSGGAGGCGGAPGSGGGAGGGSFALVVLGGAVSFAETTLRASAGGAGGPGGLGQFGGVGGPGGAGGAGGVAACDGGKGGTGGIGGSGGGGRGGPSVALAHRGAAPSQAGVTLEVSAVPAAGGAGGLGNVPGAAGGAGVAAPVQAYP